MNTSYSSAAARRILRNAFRQLIVLAFFVSLVSCTRETPVEGTAPVSHEEFARQLEASGLSKTAMGQLWLESARTAMSEPLEVILPYAENGGFLAHRAGALGLIFDAFDGQTLHLNFERRADAEGRVFVELFYVREPLEEARHVRLRGLVPDESSMEVSLPYDGRYLVRLQPELLIDTLYNLRIELGAAMPFPVQIEDDSVGSFFGDPRDAGSRQHEGIDIFAPRHTPVVAVAAGRASTRTTPRGGNVVWLRTDDRAYYYAHLERAAIDNTRRVAAGEILGYVGNSGNAVTTPTHLHFGVYRRGRGAMDPLPRLASRRFEELPPAADFIPHHVRTHAGKLNLRSAPDTSAAVVDQLDAGSILKATALRGDWLRIRTPAGIAGWIHAGYQEDASSLGSWQVHGPTLIVDSLGTGSRPVALVPAGDELEVIGRYATHLLVRSGDGQEGWVTGPLQDVPNPAVVVAAEGDPYDDSPDDSASPGS